MSILDEINEAINEAFLDDQESAFRPALLIKVSDASGSAFGPPSSDYDEEQCRAFVEDYDEITAHKLGIPDTDVRIMILQKNDFGFLIEVANGDQIETTGKIIGRWALTRVKQDPARACWTAQGHPIAEADLPPGPDRSFSITAGDDIGAGYLGYSDGDMLPATGSISRQPIEGQQIKALIKVPESDQLALYSNSDMTDILSGSSLTVEGINYSLMEISWDGSFFAASYSAAGVQFIAGQQYQLSLLLVE